MSSLSAIPNASIRPAFGRRRSFSFNTLVSALGRCWGMGSLTMVGPNGRAHRIEGASPGLDARIEVHDARFVRRVLASGDIGFADSFIAGEWDSPDLAKLLTAFSANYDHMARLLGGNPAVRLVNAVAHALNRNSRSGSRRNIHAHYDLGDDFYRLWLDAGMNYSSALFTQPGQSLAAAQRNKHAALAEAMDLKPGQSLLEIGCGWGDFARFAAVEYGANVTAVTVSRAQHDFAAHRMQAEGLSDRVTLKLCDYRDIQGQFDRIASIEMFEAVGVAYWPVYFDRVRDLLTPTGRAALQIITIQDTLFEDYRRRPDFIQLHIFPGGMLPSETRLRQETDRAGLQWANIRRFGQDYADTLAEWARLYRAQAGEIHAQGFDVRFDRLWRYYLAYCEAGFRTERTDVIQLGLTKG
ncbi:cyclopropane-fatty-acyl-phospholipid synthase family protein [Caulobacter sp. S45]|uniref:SAM-dependent methyltransferase n=1 Tax=Caulobacter sp. S45 TaxID=1641861 RepID=UPI00131E778C|nr:cyclopropane-fatty-acyl-phospholipid synthase family protein [Caulobacter sp. S45]